jgi:GR25 family glycosyltransferase involved in LPS biosynthesis
MKTFVINLKKREDRKKHVQETYPKIPFMDMEIIQACDGKEPKNNTKQMNQEVINFIELMTKNNNKFNSMKYGELGVWVSQLSIWKKMISENIDRALILEDDLTEFHDNFESILKDLTTIESNKYHIIWLNYPHSASKVPTKLTPNVYYGKHANINSFYGAYGYILSLNGAKFLLNYINNLYKKQTICGVDTFMVQSLYKENIDCHYTYNKLVNTRVQGGIMTDKDLNKKDITYTDIQIHRGYDIKNRINDYKAKVNLYLK